MTSSLVMSPLGAGLVGFVLACVLTPVARAVAFRLNVVAVPKADRWHRTRIALLGGVAIAVAVLAGVVVSGAGSRAVWPLLGGALVLAAVGLYDDVRPLKPQSKLVAQILVASGLVALGMQLRLTGVGAVDVLITLLWIVGMVNAFNLLDNMDGLAAGVAAIAIGFRLAFLLMDGNLEAARFAAVCLGATLGFLIFNFNPASIFMGDTGSLFLGVIVGGLSLVGGWPYSRSVVSVLLLPVLLLLVPIFDTTFVTLARTLAGRRVSQGGRDHTSHRLVALGLSEREAVLLLYGLSIAAGTVALLSYRSGLSKGIVLVTLFTLGLALFGLFLGRLKVYDETQAGRRGAFMVLADLRYKRQIATVMMDLVLVLLAYYSAYLLRFEGRLGPEQQTFVESLPFVIAGQSFAFAVFRVYSGLWRYTSLHDLFRLVKATTLGTGLAMIGVLSAFRFQGHSRAVFVVHWLLLTVMVGASRLSFRALAELLTRSPQYGEHILVYGAGDGGLMILREIRNNRDLRWRVVGFLDDDREKHRTTVAGVPVLGGVEQFEKAAEAYGVTRVVVSSSKVGADQIAALRTLCQQAGITLQRAALRFEDQ